MSILFDEILLVDIFVLIIELLVIFGINAFEFTFNVFIIEIPPLKTTLAFVILLIESTVEKNVVVFDENVINFVGVTLDTLGIYAKSIGVALQTYNPIPAFALLLALFMINLFEESMYIELNQLPS